MLLPQQPEVKGWTHTWGSLPPCPPLVCYHLPPVSFCSCFLCFPFFSRAPLPCCPSFSPFLGGKGSDPLLPQHSEPSGWAVPGPPEQQLCSVPPDCPLQQAGSKVGFKELPTASPQWGAGMEQGNGSQAEQWQDFSALSSLLFLGFPGLPWCCLGSLLRVYNTILYHRFL